MNLEKLTTIDELPLFLTVSDVSRLLGIGRQNAYELCHSNNFPAVIIGRRIVVPKLGLIEWMKNPKEREIMPKKSNGEGSIYKNGNKFIGQVTMGRDLNGKLIRKAVSGATKKEVVQRMAELQTKASAGDINEPSKLTLSNWLDIWFKTYKEISLRPQTKQLYQILIKSIINPNLGELRLSVIRPLHIQNLFNYLNKEGYATSTLQKIKNILSPAFKVAIANKIIADNPVQGLQTSEKIVKKIRAFTREEQKAFEAAAKDSYFYAVFMVALNTGLRCGELLSLIWDDIDFENSEISVNKTLISIVDENTGKQTLIPQYMTKTQSGKRIVPLTSKTKTILEDLKRKVTPI